MENTFANPSDPFIVAGFYSRCGDCGNEMEPGDNIAAMAGYYICEDCWRDSNGE